MRVRDVVLGAVIGTTGGWGLLAAAPAVADGKTDARRESIIELRLTEDPNLTGRGLDVEVVGTSAIMNGTVKTEEDRARAEQLVLRAGIAQVDNRLMVEPPPVFTPDKNPALTIEEREERRRTAARARAREAAAALPAVETTAPAADPAPLPAAAPADPSESALAE